MSKVSIQMDPIELIDIKADTTFALALEAYKRGHELFYFNPKNLTFNNGIVTARGKNILKIQNKISEHVVLSEEETRDLSQNSEFKHILNEFKRDLYKICDPEETNKLAFEDQDKMIREYGGIEAAGKLGATGATPPPK